MAPPDPRLRRRVIARAVIGGISGSVPRRSPEPHRGRDRDQLAIVRELQSPAFFMHQPVMPLAKGLLPNSSKRPTIRVPSFLAYVSAGGAALHGVPSRPAE